MTQARGSLRRYLLVGILVPVSAFVALNAVSLYRQALAAADTAYDRTLLASAKSIGELLEVAAAGDSAQLISTLPYSALEAFEADNRSRMYYKVSGFSGEMVSGFPDLPAARPPTGQPSVYAALVHFYDDRFRDEPVRMAVLLQPVAGIAGQGMATIQVAETLELRHTLARQLLMQTLWQQALLVMAIAAAVVFVVQRATRPVRELSERLQARSETELSPLPAGDAPRELQPMVEATNQVMARLAHLLEHQKRFVRDASHQLRTPLAVLKTQVQSARRGDVEPALALAEIGATVERATELANQLLALAKVEQLRHQGDAPVVDWGGIVRAVSLDVSALIAAAQIDFEIVAGETPVRSHEWALRELTRNLLHNAIKHSPAGGRLSVRLRVEAGEAVLTVADNGPGIDPGQRQRLFQPFATEATRLSDGSGLGLAICREVVQTLGGSIRLDNREQGGQVQGLDAVVRLPLAA
ncbi:MAG: sensor histidine kinase N-terminal domain-containing protein [Rubrivivax sp.]|nr:sensor histidine kinase N-terminal domain-containing protein [Rubrivivax sp.]